MLSALSPRAIHSRLAEATPQKEIAVRQRMIRFSCLVAMLLLGGLAVAQTEFSGEIVNNQRGDRNSSKVYFGKDKMRFESTATGKDPMGGGAMIIDLNTRASIVLMPERHMYMEMPGQMMQKRNLTYDFFRTGDAENACSDWLKLPANQGGTCHKVGSETVNGRNTVKYEGTNAKGESGFVWLDPKLRFPVKWTGKDGKGGEMRNIQEGSQPASLFEIPPGFQKFDMGAMMGKMGQQQQ